MAVLFNIGNITINTAGAWALSPASQATANGTIDTTAAWVFSSTTLSTGATTCKYVVMEMYAKGTVGNIEVCVSTDGVNPATSCSVAASSLPQIISGATYYSYVLFEMDATYAGGTYYVGVRHSGVGASGATFYRSTTGTANFYRYHIASAVSTTRGAGDYLIVCGSANTGAGLTNYTVTMANDVANEYSWITIGHGGIISAPTAATSALACAAGINIWNGGEIRLGSSASPVATGNTCTLQFTCASPSQYGVVCYGGGKFTTNGSARTAGKSVTWCLLNTNEAADSKSLGVDTDTGWLDNDAIAIASTTRTYNECEAGALDGNAAADTLTVDGFAGVDGGLDHAHSGTADTQAEIILLTRNVIFTPKTLNMTNSTYIYCRAGSIVSCKWTEFRYLGSNSAGYYGVTCDCLNVVFDYCSFHRMDGTNLTGLTLLVGTSSGTVSNCTFYTCCYGIRSAAAAATTITDCVAIYSATATSYGFYITDAAYTALDGCHAAGFRTDGIYHYSTAGISNCISHSNSGAGIYMANLDQSGANLTAYYNGTYGIYLLNSSISIGKLFGNATANLYLYYATITSKTFSNLTIDNDATYDTPYAITTDVNSILNTFFYNCNIGTNLAHSTAMFNLGSAIAITKWEIVFSDCGIGDSTILASQSNLGATSYISFDSFNLDETDHRTYGKYGLIQSDTVVFNTASPAMKMTPLSAQTLTSPIFKVACNDGETVTPSVWIKTSAAYDGTAPKLYVKTNPAIGITTDTLLDTAAASGAWEELTAATAALDADGIIEFYLTCGGAGYTTGFVNVDDFTVT